jgi:hypothetical protein
MQDRAARELGWTKDSPMRLVRYPAQLVLQDVLTLHGSQFRSAALIVASPPCQAYSYRAMPWSRAKALPPPDNTLFDACFRIQREAIEAAGHFIPLVVENVHGAQKWVGRARWNFGSFYLWGDVPALMPVVKRLKVERDRRCDCGHYESHHDGGSDQPCNRCPCINPRWIGAGMKTIGHLNRRDGYAHTKHLTNPDEHGRKQPGIGGLRDNGKGDAWFQDGAARHGSKSSKRKAASAMIAKIPLVLARHIGWAWHPERLAA